MSAGYPLDKAGWDGVMGAAVWQLETALDEVNRIYNRLADTDVLPDSVLTTMGYTSGDITVMRAAFLALSNLRKLAYGQMTQPAANNFFYDAKHLTGVRG